MTVIRYCGDARVRLTLDARGEHYKCTVINNAGERTRVVVGVPATITKAIDAPEAFDDAARAAIAFAEHEHGAEAVRGCAYTGEGPYLQRRPGALQSQGELARARRGA